MSLALDCLHCAADTILRSYTSSTAIPERMVGDLGLLITLSTSVREQVLSVILARRSIQLYSVKERQRIWVVAAFQLVA